MNRLASETSPYLLQHKDNPVDWHVWSAETLAEAAALDKPILLSIGYSACHWCHVMAQESFEDPDTAALMNDLFIPIKVDREERPDLDAIYQNALALLGQNGGWPLTMFLTAKGEPFWGGTYYPPVNKYGRMAFGDVLRRAADVYRNHKPSVEKNTKALSEGLKKLSAAPPDNFLSPDVLNEIGLKLAGLIDPVAGGLGQSPKFPQSPVFSFLWRSYKRTGSLELRDSILLTLDRMCQGGIYDHLGGGFSRYSTDAMWLVPHFEKMLYDNAQLIELLTWVCQETKNPLYADRVGETISWILREMDVGGGGFASALDADSEHEEGRFYAWTAAEIDSVLGADAALFKAHYDVHRIGNWEGKTILNRSEKPEFMDSATEKKLACARQKLWSAREARIRPARDHKVLADWNGLTISALCLAAGAFGKSDWLEAARRAFDFVRIKLTAPDGRLFHSWCEGRVHSGLIDDYAAMSRAALSLFQATADNAYLAAAEQWVALLNTYYRDDERGGYFFTPSDAPDLIVRLRNAYDHATPSGNGMMVEVLATLYYLTGQLEYRNEADYLIGAFAAEAARNAISVAGLMSGMDFLLDGIQIVLCPGVGMDGLLRAIHDCCLPNRIISVIAEGEDVPGHHPAAGKRRIGAQATAYICRGQSCSLPLTEPQALRAALSGPLRL
ncbi:MAG: thioredoxin domain-containing protein [Rhizomicrobium sp.]